MAYGKKPAGESKGLQKLKQDLSAAALGEAYIFYGQESYLREYYLEQVRKKLVPDGFEAFNYHRVEGKDVDVQALAEMAEAMPMMAERTLVVAVDLDLFKLGEGEREKLAALLEDIPPYCCMVFVYDTVEYKPNKTMKKLCKAIDAHVQAVEFRPVDSHDLESWIARRFRALGKDVDRRTAEHLIFTCGGLMTGLVPEIAKIAAYAKGPSVTQGDIDAVATPVLSAEVFRLADAVLQGQFGQAASILENLLKMQTEPIAILASLGWQLRRIYTARLAIDGGRDKYWLMELWGMDSDFQANRLLTAARRGTAKWCADAVRMCQTLDRRMKSETGIDPAGELKLLLVRLEAARR